MPEHRTSKEAAHDVLAAEAFAMPGADPSLHAQPIRLPDDPTGIEEPHDVLAAEDFAMPAPPRSAVGAVLARTPESIGPIVAAALAGFLLALALGRLLRRH